MSRIAAFATFLWEFVIGDDWRIAAGIVIAIAVTALAAGAGAAAWWILPLAVIVILGLSLWQAAART